MKSTNRLQQNAEIARLDTAGKARNSPCGNSGTASESTQTAACSTSKPLYSRSNVKSRGEQFILWIYTALELCKVPRLSLSDSTSTHLHWTSPLCNYKQTKRINSIWLTSHVQQGTRQETTESPAITMKKQKTRLL